MSNPHVLLTGANGFIASHILAHLLKANYTVTATVRSQKKADAIIATHPDWKENVSFALVPDLFAASPFDHVFQRASRPFDYVIHAASPLPLQASDMLKEAIEPAVDGTRKILESAQQFGGERLKRVVLLGSVVSILDQHEDMTKEREPYTEKDWSPLTQEKALELNDITLAYSVGKRLAEQSAWAFMEANRPAWDLVVTNPGLVTGPLTQAISGAESVNSTTDFLIRFFISGVYPTVEDAKFPIYHQIDVRDVARAHVQALTNPAAANKRLLLVEGLITPQLVVNAIRARFPELRDRVPEGTPSQIRPPGLSPAGCDDRATREILAQGGGGAWEYVDFETSVADTVQSLLDHDLV